MNDSWDLVWLISFLLGLTITVWSIYLVYRIAVHVSAWPFG